MKKIATLAQLQEAMIEGQRLKAEIDTKLAEANTKFAEANQELLDEVGDLQEKFSKIDSTLNDFVREHKDDPDYFTDDKKTFELIGGKLSWKDGSPKVECTEGFDEDSFPRLARKHNLEDLIRPRPEELDKSAVIRLYNTGEVTDDKLAKLGIKVTTEPTFKVEYKAMTAPKKKKVAA